MSDAMRSLRLLLNRIHSTACRRGFGVVLLCKVIVEQLNDFGLCAHILGVESVSSSECLQLCESHFVAVLWLFCFFTLRIFISVSFRLQILLWLLCFRFCRILCRPLLGVGGFWLQLGLWNNYVCIFSKSP